MGELAGKSMEIRISDSEMSDGNDGAKINGADNATFNKLKEILEITQFTDKFRKRKGGLKDSNLDISGNYDPTDTDGQLKLDPHGDNEDVWVALFPEGNESGKSGKQIKMIAESFEQSAEADGKQEFSATLQGNGEPTDIDGAD